MDGVEFKVLALLVLVFAVLAGFGAGGHLFVFLGRGVFWILKAPFSILRWNRTKKILSRKKRSYEVLATYMPLLEHNPRLLHYLETLIAEGIDPERLESTLARNARLVEAMDARRRVRETLIQVEKEAGLSEMAAEHRRVLAESKAHLERLRFKEKALEGLVAKLRKREPH